MTQGKFITFEGGEGSGKSTQIKLLSESLRGKNINTVLTREPGGTPAGEAIRGLLVTGTVDKFSPTSEALLNYAARAEHLRSIIIPSLEQGKWVLSDRFNDSTFAYQGGGVPTAFLEELDQTIVGNNQPDMTFILDLDPAIGLKRATERLKDQARGGASEDRFEKKGIEYHTKIRKRFLERAAGDTSRYHVINTTNPVEEVAREIWGHVLKLFNK